MKGIVFNLLEEAVVEAHGPDVWDRVLDEAGVDGVYTSLGNYPDAEAMALVAAICEQVGAPADAVLRDFGRAALPGLVARYPEFAAAHGSAKSFLLRLDDTIHPDVVKLYPDARPPRFRFEDPAPDVLVMHYVSERRLCAMAEGMIEASAAHFGEALALEQTACMRHGAPACTFVATFG
jgi:predicted hydrocarbon binding protein